MENSTTRFRGAEWFDEAQEICPMIGGAGGIGSWLTMFLARANFIPTVFDYDTVEEHNLGGQFFRLSDVEENKIDAVANTVKLFTPTPVNTLEVKLTEDIVAAGNYKNLYTFSAFDNMEARKMLFNLWAESLEYVSIGDLARSIFIDGRLEMEQMQIYCIKGDDYRAIERYRREALFSDDSVPDLSCTMKQTSHCAAMIAAKMVGFFTNHISNINLGFEVREVPFFYEYVIAGNITETYSCHGN